LTDATWAKCLLQITSQHLRLLIESWLLIESCLLLIDDENSLLASHRELNGKQLKLEIK